MRSAVCSNSNVVDCYSLLLVDVQWHSYPITVHFNFCWWNDFEQVFESFHRESFRWFECRTAVRWLGIEQDPGMCRMCPTLTTRVQVILWQSPNPRQTTQNIRLTSMQPRRFTRIVRATHVVLTLNQIKPMSKITNSAQNQKKGANT